MRWFQAYKVYPQLPMKHQSVLPDEGFSRRLIQLNTDRQLFPVSCYPKGKGKHRVVVHCTCGREIPFGRMGQHLPHRPTQKDLMQQEN